jgi:hypothetical protein
MVVLAKCVGMWLSGGSDRVGPNAIEVLLKHSISLSLLHVVLLRLVLFTILFLVVLFNCFFLVVEPLILLVAVI